MIQDFTFCQEMRTRAPGLSSSEDFTQFTYKSQKAIIHEQSTHLTIQKTKQQSDTFLLPQNKRTPKLSRNSLLASHKETNMKTITDYILSNPATLIVAIPLLLVVTFFIGLAIVLLKWPRPRPVQVISLQLCHV